VTSAQGGGDAHGGSDVGILVFTVYMAIGIIATIDGQALM